MVDSLDGVDEAGETVYFTATAESPLEAHLYAASLADDGDPSAPRRITQAAGMHSVVIDPHCRRFADTHQGLDTPPGITLRALPGGAGVQSVYENDDPRIAALDLRPPELVTLTSRDGATLYGAIYRPDRGTAPYPTIVSVYGGPHAQMVDNSWRMTVDLRAQYLRAQGFLVFKLDNRGSARRGLAFEGALKHHMGSVEVRDQEDGVRWLADQDLADPQRVGMYGWSYGGYMALMCLAAGGSFRAAVAGAPVTAWDGYDTHYTERYMGTPQSNPEGYHASSPIHRAADMHGRLMLVHGLIDENVHFRHTARLINGLIAARKTYDLLLFPDERHSPRRLGDRVFMEEQIVQFFRQELVGEKE
jgi:dipeptidyl-peptidase-4